MFVQRGKIAQTWYYENRYRFQKRICLRFAQMVMAPFTYTKELC